MSVSRKNIPLAPSDATSLGVYYNVLKYAMFELEIVILHSMYTFIIQVWSSKIAC